jgi:hypothetical protein
MKSKNLAVEKLTIFLNNINQSKVILPPLECDHIIMNKGGFAPKVFDKDLKFWFEYNFNDCYYTFLLFTNFQEVQNHIKSRILFYTHRKFKNYTYCQSLNLSDANLGKNYLKENAKIPQILDGREVRFQDIHVLSKYPKILPFYKKEFQHIVYGTSNKKIQLDIFDLSFKFSQGGIHSVWKDHSKKQCKILKSDSKFSIYDFDVMGFYVEILLKLFQAFGMTETYDFFKSLGEERNRLKKLKDPLQGILKIIILSIPGNLNSPHSGLYNPVLYFSMTANGQLFIAQTIYEILEYCDDLIFANTDGFCIKFQNNSKERIFQKLDQIEQKYGYIIDTRMKIQKGFLFDVNTYIIQYENSSELKVKGFDKKTEKIVIEFLKYCLNNNIDNFQEDNVCSIIYEFLLNYKKPSNVIDFLQYRKYNEDRKLYYFSKKPQSFNGAYIGGSRFDSPKPVSYITYENLQNFHMNSIQEIQENLDLLSYFQMLLEKLIHYGFLNENFEKKISIFHFQKFFPIENILEHRYVLYMANKIVQSNNVYLLPKQIDNKNFRDYSGKNTETFNVPALQHFQNSLDRDFYFWLNAAAFTMVCSESFPYVSINWNDTSFLFDESNKNLILFFLHLKNLGNLVLSSVIKNGGYCFKIFLKVEDFESIKSFHTFMAKYKKKYGFEYEKFASILGNHYLSMNFKGFHYVSSWPSFKKDFLHSLFEHKQIQNQKILISLEFYQNLSYLDLLTKLFENREYNADLYWNEEAAAKKSYIRFYKKLDVNQSTNQNMNLDLLNSLNTNLKKTSYLSLVFLKKNGSKISRNNESFIHSEISFENRTDIE